MKPDLTQIGIKIKNVFLIILGTASLALATAAFLVPFELVAGGISGLAIVINSLLGGGFLSVEIIITVLTWISFFAGLIFLGKSFALKTLLSSALYPLLVAIFIERGLSDSFRHFLDLEGGMLIAAALGGALVGIGCALSFKSGGSTGGVDVLALTLCKKHPTLKLPRLMLIIDTAIIIFGAFAIADPKKTLFGIFSALTSAFTIEAVLNTKFKAFWTNWRDKKIDKAEK